MTDLYGQARILDALLSRLHSNQIRKLANLHEKAEYAGANLGASAQLEAQNKALTHTEFALNRITQYDRDVIARIITDELLNKEGEHG